MTTLSTGHAVDVAGDGSGSVSARSAVPRPVSGRSAGPDGPHGLHGELHDDAGTGGSQGLGAGVAATIPDNGPVTTYHLNVDGALHTVTGAWVGASLLSVLRDILGITAVKDACEQGRCGSCSVLLDGRMVAACTVLAADAADTRVTTVAGLSPASPVRAVQEALLAHGAVQCGYCTPGLVVAVTDLLGRGTSPDDDEIREALAGNVCRCTGYGRIIAAVRALVDAQCGSATHVRAVAGSADGGPVRDSTVSGHDVGGAADGGAVGGDSADGGPVGGDGSE